MYKVVDGHVNINYMPSPTSNAFMLDDSFVKGLRGPVGSGKSVTCIFDLFRRAQEQKPFNGIRSTRWAGIRNTFSQLHTTVLKSWKEWFPETHCVIRQTPFLSANLKQDLSDGTRMEMEVLFLALDQADDMKKLLSLELTGAWINEARELPKAILDGVTQRVNRYPPVDAGGPTWTGVIMDTNPPDTDHWWYRIFEKECPRNWKQFVQPPALFRVQTEGKEFPEYIPNRGQVKGVLPAENIDHLSGGYQYYLNMVGGKTEEWINVYVLNEYGTVVDGKPVYPEYHDTVHRAKEELDVFYGIPIIIGIDLGLTPAAAFCQISPSGQFRVIDEIVTENMSLRQFATDLLRPHCMNNYHGAQFVRYCDPAGTQQSASDAKTYVQLLQECGVPVLPAGTSNRFPHRRESLVKYMIRKSSDGEEAFLVSPKCEMLRQGLMGRYCFRRIRVAGDERYHDEPSKNKWSHIVEACQYAAVGMDHGAMNSYAGQDGSGYHNVRKKPIVTRKWV